MNRLELELERIMGEEANVTWGLRQQIDELLAENKRLREALSEAIVNIPLGADKDSMEREKYRLLIKRLKQALDKTVQP